MWAVRTFTVTTLNTQDLWCRVKATQAMLLPPQVQLELDYQDNLTLEIWETG
jgi:hypothetical protein